MVCFFSREPRDTAGRLLLFVRAITQRLGGRSYAGARVVVTPSRETSIACGFGHDLDGVVSRDVTVAFRAKNDISDLGGRDRVHFLVRCQEP
jgi:hypothetical protein